MKANDQEERIRAQQAVYKKGFPKVELIRPASVGDGIRLLDQGEEEYYLHLFDSIDCSIEKFVPASGAATRMFADLIAYKNTGHKNAVVNKILEHADRLSFISNSNDIINDLLEVQKLGSHPKGLIPFHKYDDHVRTPVEEQIVEFIDYSGKEPMQIHFTVSPKFMKEFQTEVEYVSKKISKGLNVTFSVQDMETNTMAVDLNDIPFILDGEQVWRPSGHGALLKNLNERESDLIFIKNIDNVVPDRLKGDTIRYKKIMAGMLSEYQRSTFGLLRRSDEGVDITTEGIRLLEEMGNSDVPKSEVRNFLNRPLRVCGMVMNTGEPGGGPFWVNSDGRATLQVVEQSQISSDPEQQEILQKSTHFNPVDIVCSTKDYKGQKFNLSDFRDDNAGIITTKKIDGRSAKVLELPGLWNGGMAHWNTVLMEVPITTFNPVKTLADLLRPEHQA